MNRIQAIILSSLAVLALISPISAMEMVSDKTITIVLADDETANIPDSEWHILQEMISYKDLVDSVDDKVSLPSLTKNGLDVLRKYLTVIKDGGVPLNELLLKLLKDESSQEFHELVVAADYLDLEHLITSLTYLFDSYFIFTFPPPLGNAISVAEWGILKRLIALPVRLRATRQEALDRVFLSAAEKGNEETMQFLLGNDCVDVNCCDTIKQTAFMKILKHSQNKKLLEYLLEKGADVAHKDICGINALMIAAACPNDCIELVTIVFNKGTGKVTINETSSNGYTPLIYASEMDNSQVVAFLLKQGADVTRHDIIGRNALVIASGSSRDCTNAVELLIKHDGVPKLDINETVRGRNALKQASEMGHEKIVGLLLKAGAREGLNKALSLAIQGGHQAVVQLLSQHGAVVEQPSAQEIGEQNFEGWF